MTLGGGNSAVFKLSFPLWKNSGYTLLCHHLLSPLQSLSIRLLTVTSLLSVAKSYLPWSSSLLPFDLGIHLFYHQNHHFLPCILSHAIADFYYSAQIFLPGSTTDFQYPVSYLPLKGSGGHKQCLTSFHHDLDKRSNLMREYLTKYILKSSSMD